MQPRIGAAVTVERCFEVLRADRVIIVVLNVVLAGPGTLIGAPTIRDSSAASAT